MNRYCERFDLMCPHVGTQGQCNNLEPCPNVKYDDAVIHPAHYTKGKIECIDALESMVSSFNDAQDAALSWQIVKYTWRHPHKGKPVEDLKKARFYLDRLIKHWEGKNGTHAV